MSYSAASSSAPSSIPAYAKNAQVHFHRVQEGETPLGIAAKYNVSAEQFNSALNPKAGDLVVVNFREGRLSPETLTA
jgi:hypothetical protein